MRCTLGMLAAIERARLEGKTPLLVDNSQDRVIDVFFSYQRSQVLEAKMLPVDERQGMARSAVLERVRGQLVKAMRFGQVLYIRLSNSACDFCNKYSGPDTLPLQVFDNEEVVRLNRLYGSGAGDSADEGVHAVEHSVGANLWGSSSPFAAVLREEDTDRGVFVPRRGFEVVLCTTFGTDDFAEFLESKLPMEALQPIAAVQHESQSAGFASKAGIRELLVAVEDCCQEMLRVNTRESREALEAALRALLLEVGARELPEEERQRLDAQLAAQAVTFKTAVLRPLNTCAVHRAFACLPALVETVRQMLAAAPAKGVSSLLEEAALRRFDTHDAALSGHWGLVE